MSAAIIAIWLRFAAQVQKGSAGEFSEDWFYGRDRIQDRH